MFYSLNISVHQFRKWTFRRQNPKFWSSEPMWCVTKTQFRSVQSVPWRITEHPLETIQYYDNNNFWYLLLCHWNAYSWTRLGNWAVAALVHPMLQNHKMQRKPLVILDWPVDCPSLPTSRAVMIFLLNVVCHSSHGALGSFWLKHVGWAQKFLETCISLTCV